LDEAISIVALFTRATVRDDPPRGREPMIQSTSRRRPLVKAGLAVGAVFVVTVTSAGSALGSPPVGGCPTAEWELRASPSPEISGWQSTDGNGDGLSCFLEAPEGGGIFTIVDNISHSRG
jgi:hypothetical protein